MKIYEQAKDLHVRKVVVYGNTTNNKVYVDEEKKTEAAKVDLVELFEKGMLLVSAGDDTMAPVAVSGNTLVCVKYATNALTAVAFTMKA